MSRILSKVGNETLDKLYKKYSKTIPILGSYIVGDAEPYDYLIKTINEFYDQNTLQLLRTVVLAMWSSEIFLVE